METDPRIAALTEKLNEAVAANHSLKVLAETAEENALKRIKERDEAKDLADRAMHALSAIFDKIAEVGTSGAALICAERNRQILQEGWTSEHDDTNSGREMARAALSYVKHYVERAWVIDNELGLNVEPGDYQNAKAPDEWPDNWDEGWWKPKGKIEDLVRAGALIAAEIDRIQGAEKKEAARQS